MRQKGMLLLSCLLNQNASFQRFVSTTISPNREKSFSYLGLLIEVEQLFQDPIHGILKPTLQ